MNSNESKKMFLVNVLLRELGIEISFMQAKMHLCLLETLLTHAIGFVVFSYFHECSCMLMR